MTAIPRYFATPNNLLQEYQKIATEDTVNYFYKMAKPPEFIPGEEPETFKTMDDAKAKLREMIASKVTIDGFVAEFGVDKGKSFIQLCDLFPDDTVYGFDSFDGLPEDGKWSGNIVHQDAFKNEGKVPFNIPTNGAIIDGWFENTLPKFEVAQNQSVKYLHIDCDVYDSTVTVLTHLADAIVPGTIIVFDDYCNAFGWRQGEWKAWQEFVDANGVKYEYIYVAGMATGIKVLEK